jgi:hypothetical protein
MMTRMLGFGAWAWAGAALKMPSVAAMIAQAAIATADDAQHGMLALAIGTRERLTGIRAS